MRVEELVNYVRRTNPEMTKEKLLKEMKKSRYSASSLLFTIELEKKYGCKF